jgi:hypothetical protein
MELEAYSVISSSLLSSTRRRFLGGLDLLSSFISYMQPGRRADARFAFIACGGFRPWGFHSRNDFIIEREPGVMPRRAQCVIYVAWCGNLRNIKHHGFVVTMVRTGPFMNQDTFELVGVLFIG